MLKKPNIFIVGAAKAGTTAMHSMLGLHPKIFMSPVKEPNFFSKDILVDNFDSSNRMKFQNLNYERDEDGNILPRHQLYLRKENDYFNLFDKALKEHDVLGEASVSYLYSKVAAAEIYKFNKDAKIIIILRDPVERAFSHYLMDLKVGRISPNVNFANFALKEYEKSGYWGKDPLYLELGLYFEQVKRYTDIFPKENILLMSYKDFRKDNIAVMNKIYNFLKLSPIELDFSVHKKNSAKVPKNILAAMILRSPLAKMAVRSFINPKILKGVRNKLMSSKNLPQLDATDRLLLNDFFSRDLQKLSDHYNIDIQM